MECQEVAEHSVSSGYGHLEAEGAASLRKLTVLEHDLYWNVRPHLGTTTIVDCHTGSLRQKPLV